MEDCKLNNESFIVIKPFMITELNLSGNALIIYAAIYGVTVNHGVFYGSLEYLSKWCNCTTRNVINCLKKLTDAGLLKKKRTQNGCIYESTYKEDDEEKKVELDTTTRENYSEKNSHEDFSYEKSSEQSEKSSLSKVKKVHIGSEKSSHNNIVNNLVDNINLNSSTTKSKVSKTEQKKQECEQYLNLIPLEIKDNSDSLVKFMFNSFKESDPSFNRRREQLLEWQVEFAKFLITSHRSISEVTASMQFAFNSKWSEYIFNPAGFIRNYEKILRQSVVHNRWENKQTTKNEFTNGWTPEKKRALQNKISLGELAITEHGRL